MLEPSAGTVCDAPAIVAAERAPLTYRGLLGQLDEVHAKLRQFGVGLHDRVAVAVPNGPELAVAVLSIAASATCAPLNPAYREDEYDSILQDLRASFLVVPPVNEARARASAERLGISVIELVPRRDTATGLFTLRCDAPKKGAGGGFAAGRDTAMLFQTSGTTGRPKLVPLTHVNVWFSARQRIAALELTAQDRCLDMMPLYHSAGFNNLLGTLASGGSVCCPPRLDAESFFEGLDQLRPSWYAAVPVLQLAILAKAKHYPNVLAGRPLRFIRTGTGTLSGELLAKIERVFGAPVIQTYGMTETGTIASNPMPPRVRKVGSVGVPAGPEVAILNDAGARLERGSVGEVAVRGPNVFPGYEGPAGNAAAFPDGWFRTGDLGTMDDDGYLFLKGRIKDLINRGGAKVSLREVEECLAEHPAVARAVVFALPHATLGEDVAAAVVLRPGVTATEPDLRQFAAQHLADFKVPCRVAIVDEIPTNPTGKVRRQGLADHFRPFLATPSAPPQDPLEQTLARIWTEELHVDRVGVHDNFFELGGDSLRAAQTCLRVQTTTGLMLSVATLYAMPTVAQLARVLQRNGVTASPSSYLVPIQTGGTRLPLFCLHSRWGYTRDYVPLALRLGPDQPVYGVNARGTNGLEPVHARIEDMAAHCVHEIRTAFPQGPYVVCGYSSAGILAWEVAQQFLAQGHRVAMLVLLDPILYVNPALPAERAPVLPAWRRRVQLHVAALRERSPRDRAAYVIQRFSKGARERSGNGSTPISAELDLDAAEPSALQALLRIHRTARTAYLPRPYPGPVALFLVQQPEVNLHYDPRLPGRLATGPVEIYDVPGDHGTCLQEPRVRVLADKLRACITKAQAGAWGQRSMDLTPSTAG